MKKDPVLEKYENEGFGKNAFGWYFNPWISEYDEDYDPHNDKEYNEALNKKENKENEDESINQDNVEIKKVVPEPVIVEPTTEDPEPVKPQQTKPVEEIDNSEYNVFDIDISPIENKMRYGFTNLKDKIRTNVENIQGLNYTQKEIENYIKVLKEFATDYDIEKLEKAIDPNILRLLVENDKSGNGIKAYLDMLSGKDVAFKLRYSLKGIYDSDLDPEQIKNMSKIAKAAKKFSKGRVEVEKDNIFVNAYKSIRKMLGVSRQDKLEESKQPKKINDEEKSSKTVKEEYEPRHARTKKEYEPKHAKAEEKQGPRHAKSKTSVISKAKSIAVSAGKETIGGIRILGTRLTGFLTRENKLATESKVRAIRGNSFVPKVKVDEKKAVEKVTASENEDKILDTSWLKEGVD